MGIYDRGNYGLARYGPDLIATAYPGSTTVLPTVDFAYLLPETAAQAQNYTNVLVSWGNPDYTTFQTVTEFRLLSNPWGFPVDENDGTILLDVTGAPPNIPSYFIDSSATPGKLMYYGIYMLTGSTWVRSGFAAELLPFDHGNAARLLQLMPEYFRSWGYEATQVVQPPVRLVPPPVPVSGTTMVNPYPFDVRVFIDGTFTGITVNGVPLGVPQSFVLLGGGSVTVSYPFPVWSSGNTYNVGNAVLSGGIAYVCIEQITSLTEPAEDPDHWKVFANSPYVPWVTGQSYNAGQIVTYGAEYYLVEFSVPVSTIQPGVDTTNFSLISPTNVSWDWQEIPVSDTDDFLAEYLAVLGYGLDILRSQYDFELDGLNNPMKMSLGDLQNFCAEIGMPFTTELPAYLMRKAALFWTRVMLERGTLEGIAEHITLFSGYSVDLSLSRNILLEDDISVPIDPVYSGWSAFSKYAIGDKVTYPVAQNWNILSTYPVGAIINYNGLLYECILESVGFPPTDTLYWDQNVLGPFTYEALKVVDTLPGPQPSGSDTELDPTDTWQPIYGGSTGASTPVTEVINIPPFITDAALWEALTPGGSELEAFIGVGYPNPLVWNTDGGAGTPNEPPQDDSHTFFGVNSKNFSTAMWMRYPARSEDDIIDDDGNHTLDQQLAVQHATPVPQSTLWDATTDYIIGSLVQYGNVFYLAQRGSVGATPPVLDMPLGIDPYMQDEGEIWNTQNGATTSWVTSPALVGLSALNIAYSGTAAGISVADGTKIPVIPGATYTVNAALNMTGTGQEVTIGISWYDQFGVFISTSQGSDVTYTAGSYAPYAFTATAPVNAASAARVVAATQPSAGTWTSDINVGYLFLICEETPEWAPLGRDNRLHLWSSAYTLSNLGIHPNSATAVSPFMEYYDDWGNFIGRGFGRQSGGLPAGYGLDSFSVGVNWPFAMRLMDTGGQWTVEEGSFAITPDLGVSAVTAGGLSLAVTTTPAAATQAVTYTNGQSPSHDQGIVFWYQDNNNYWYSGRFGLYYSVSGTLHLAHSYTEEIGIGDRVYVWTNNTATTQTMGGITVVGPSIVVWENWPFAPGPDEGEVLLIMSASPTAGQVPFPTSPSPVLPSTSATNSLSGIIEEVEAP